MGDSCLNWCQNRHWRRCWESGSWASALQTAAF